MNIFKKIIGILIMAIVFLAIYLFGNFFRFDSKQLVIAPTEKIALDVSSHDRFSKAIQIKTISYDDGMPIDSSAFYDFNDLLLNNYPLINSKLEHNSFNEFSHLFKWEGTDDGLDPIIIMGHIDVVPIPAENRKDWTLDPFSGKIQNQIFWGRGAIDDKLAIIASMEAIEQLLSTGFKPKRSVYLSFGHDEEIGGINGAREIAQYLAKQHIKAEFVIDEGSMITQKMIPGISDDVALIGIAEKGFVSVELSVEIEGGHSAIPNKQTAIDVLSAAIAKLKHQPIKTKITSPLQAFIDHIGPEMSIFNKFIFANSNVFGFIIKYVYNQSPTGSAMIRTTTAPTIFQSGVKENVIPKNASATVNFRTLPGDSENDVLKHIISVINDDRIQAKVYPDASAASKVSDPYSGSYALLHKTIKEIYPHVIVAPSLVLGGTDSKHFNQIAKNTFRFIPYVINPDNVHSFHGINERLPVSEFENSIRFYMRLIQNFASPEILN